MSSASSHFHSKEKCVYTMFHEKMDKWTLYYIQWHTGEGVRGLEPLPLAYDLRNTHVRMHQNMFFSNKNMKNFLESGHIPFTRPIPQWGGGYPLSTPHPPRRLQHLDTSHYKILGMPLIIFHHIFTLTKTIMHEDYLSFRYE